MARTTEQVRRDIDSEREQLASALDDLRGSLGAAADIGGKLKSKLPVVAGAAASVGFVLAGGVGATPRGVAPGGRRRTAPAGGGRVTRRRA